MIIISKDVLGTSRHLCQLESSGDFIWVKHIPSDAWVWANDMKGSLFDLKEVFKIQNIDFPTLVPEAYYNSIIQLGVDTSSVKWHLTMRNDELLMSLRKVFSTLWEGLVALAECGYSKIYQKSKKVMGKMTPAKIDFDTYRGYKAAEKNKTTLSTLATFYSTTGRAPCVKYDMTSTVTGRLIVSCGPRILTLPSAYRDIIASSYTNGKVVEIDYISLEPRIALLCAGKKCSTDIYEHISQVVFNGKLSRKESKIATLCALYGVSARKLDEMIKKTMSSRDVIKKVREYFNFNKVAYGLQKEFLVTGHIKNMFGRPIFVEKSALHLLYNNFIQSSAVDAAMLGFFELIKETTDDSIELQTLVFDS